MNNNPIKKTFRSTLLVGLIPFFMILMIVTFVIWGLSAKNSKTNMSITEEKVKIDTVYVEKPCPKNHYNYQTVEHREKEIIIEKERKKRVDTIVKIDTSATKI
jgi:hypothetical protein